jgi:DNA end-binding protein Ku
MPRAIWSGAISFGLVNVPVKVYSALSRKAVRFHQLHDEDGVPIRQQRVCPADGKEVSYDHVVKGYEIAKDQYVVIAPEELEALDPRRTRTIDIQEFVELDEIDPLYYDSSYYLAPAAGAAKAYGLLLRAMQDAGKVAIGRVVIRTKEYLAAIRPAGDVLVMVTMVFGDEVVDPDRLEELPARDGKPSKRETEMARRLIDSLSVDFDPHRHRDEYRERVLELIERKAAGEEIAAPPVDRDEGPTPDLMAALEASLAEAAGTAPDSNGRGRSDGRRHGAAKKRKTSSGTASGASSKTSSKASSKGSSKRSTKRSGKGRAKAGKAS